ncbi:MAG: PilZ domain-containing protein [Bdellovibrionia bacterium]
MRNPDHWDLIQIVTRQRLTGLTSHDVFQHVNALPEAEQKNWYAWRAGMPDWACVVQLKKYNTDVNTLAEPKLQVIEPTEVAQAIAQTVPVVNPTETSVAAQSVIEKTSAAAATDRRKHRRHAVRTKIVVLFNGQAYRAFSKDISVGGLLLLNQIPWKFENATCSVFVSNPRGGQALEFSGKVLSDPKDPCRFQFQNPSEKFLDTLNDWLEGAQLNSMKSAA